MLQGFDKNGEIRGVRVTEDGKLMVEGIGGGTEGDSETTINNTSENPVPVTVENIAEETETTLAANVLTLGTTAETISVGKKVSEISVANYSDDANVTITIGETSCVIAPGIAADLPINKTVQSISFVSTEANTKFQYIIKGEE